MLCLHGYGQAGQALRAKTGALRSESKKLAEWIFAEAPHVLSREELDRRGFTHIGSADDPCEDAPRTWWRFDDHFHYDRATVNTFHHSIGGENINFNNNA